MNISELKKVSSTFKKTFFYKVFFPNWSDLLILNARKFLFFRNKNGFFTYKLSPFLNFYLTPQSFNFYSSKLHMLKTTSKTFKNFLLWFHQPNVILVRLKGTNFRYIIKDGFFWLLIGRTHDLFFKIPPLVSVAKYFEYKNVLLFKSPNFIQLVNFLFLLRKECIINPYTGSGLFFNKEKVKIKDTKKK